MKYYELTYLISPEISDLELKSLTEKINSLIKNEGEVLEELASPIKKVLALPIKKHSTAFLASIYFRLKPEKLKDLEKVLKTEEKVLRYLIFSKKITKTRQPKRKPLKEVVFKIPIPTKEKKVELKEIDEKLEEILGE